VFVIVGGGKNLKKFLVQILMWAGGKDVEFSECIEMRMNSECVFYLLWGGRGKEVLFIRKINAQGCGFWRGVRRD